MLHHVVGGIVSGVSRAGELLGVLDLEDESTVILRYVPICLPKTQP
jgi:hypothetical protein